ncbi:hypothetical protein HNE05_12100 [Aquipseudomonas campi]|uniref:DUF2946 domain-containing protein n=1 Tax=Aquipseudomonas campi TaxID=2731681 RepID=A0A6M8FJK1_9GAMM|nr:hypothetical protein [Pseudomonas campi]QKE64059.1 hypothetical protein HNE05_12100 [Pseudomonas campi]
MTNHSRTLMLAFGLALAMLAVGSLAVALSLSQDAAAARQQALVWKTYALAVHSQGLLATHDDGQGCSDSPCCVALVEHLLEQAHARLPGQEPVHAVELEGSQLQAAISASDRPVVRGFSF